MLFRSNEGNNEEIDGATPQFLHILSSAMTSISSINSKNNNNINNNSNSSKDDNGNNNEEKMKINKLNKKSIFLSFPETKAAGAKLRKSFVLTLRAIIETSDITKCDIIINSNIHKWLFLILKEETEFSDTTKLNLKGRRLSVTKKVAMEYYYDNIENFKNISILGYGDQSINSSTCTASICCQIITILSINGYSKILCNSGLCDAVLNYMMVYNQIPRAQTEGLTALIELLHGAPEHLSRLLGPMKSNNSNKSFNFFDDEKNRNPFASKSSSSTTLCASDIAQHAVNVISDILECSSEENIDDNNDNDDVIVKDYLDIMIDEQKDKLRLLLSRHKKLGLSQENCTIS